MTVSEFLDFCEYFLNDTSNKDNNLSYQKVYFDAYNSFMVCKKMSLNDIRHYRMNSIIDYYMDIFHIKNEMKQIYIKYYKDHIQDNFNKILDPPANPFFLEQKMKHEEAEIQRKEDENDDIKDHYKFLESKYKYYADIMYRMNHPQDIEDDVHENDYKIEENTDSDNLSNVDDTYEDDYCDEISFDEYEEEYYSEEDYY
jgi:hypothetical protein